MRYVNVVFATMRFVLALMVRVIGRKKVMLRQLVTFVFRSKESGLKVMCSASALIWNIAVYLSLLIWADALKSPKCLCCANVPTLYYFYVPINLIILNFGNVW